MSYFRNTIIKKITWGNLDPLGIVFYPRFYEWMDEASHIFFDKIGLNLVSLLKKRNIIFALIETGAEFIRPVRYHDDIEIVSYINEIQDKIVSIRHEIRNPSDKSLFVKGYEKRICVMQESKDKLKAINIPEDIRQIMELYNKKNAEGRN